MTNGIARGIDTGALQGPVPESNYMEPFLNSSFHDDPIVKDYRVSEDGKLGACSIRYEDESSKTNYDYVQLDQNSILIAGHGRIGSKVPSVHRQIFGDGDWIHLMFKLQGETVEETDNGDYFPSYARTVNISRYRSGTSVVRINPMDTDWRVACLLFRADEFRQALNTPDAELGSELSWLSRESIDRSHYQRIGLDPVMSAATNAILDCPMNGPLRYSFLRAKASELMSSAMWGLQLTIDAESPDQTILTPRERAKVSQVLTFLSEHLHTMVTIPEVAEAVGLSRSKLCMIFKAGTGQSVQSYVRDAKLEEARRLLMVEKLNVSEVAHIMGYSEPSPFTRAFRRKFGVSPRDTRINS